MKHAIILLLVLAAPGLAQCDHRRSSPAPEAPEAPVVPSLPQPAALDRAELIAALSRAASTYAATGEAAQPLSGRRFVVRLPFGCEGPTEIPAPAQPGFASWAWTADRRAIELRLTPADWLTRPPIGATDLEAAWANADGVWITRPWLWPETCPPQAAITLPLAQETDKTSSTDAEAPPPDPRPALTSPQSAGLAIYSPTDSSRIGRRAGQPYIHLIRGEGEEPPVRPQRGWRVLLEGRIGAFPDGRSIRCRSESRDRRPICVAAVQVDKVAFEDASTGRQLTEWRPGG